MSNRNINNQISSIILVEYFTFMHVFTQVQAYLILVEYFTFIHVFNQVQAYLCGRMRQANVRLVAGDRVGTELSVYDLTKGRIMERYKTTYEIERA